MTAVTAVVAGCLGGNDQLIEVQHHSMQEGPFNTYVTGGARNTANDPVDVTVSVTFLDGNGEEMETQSKSNDGLAPEESWSFRVEYGGDDADGVSDYELETDTTRATE